MSSVKQNVATGGRKFAVVIRTLEFGFLSTLLGLLVAVLMPSIAPNVAAIVSTFGLLGSASIVSYQGANAAKDWHTKPETPDA